MSGVATTPSPEQLQIAKVYATAVWELAAKAGTTEALLEEFESLVIDVLDREPKLEIFFGLGSISQTRRAEMLEHIFKDRASDLLLNFLRTLNRHDRLPLLRAVLVRLKELWELSQGTAPVLVRVATPLPDDQLRNLESVIAERFGIKPDIRVETDPGVLGGLWIRIGDMVYDRSVRWNLRQLRDNLLTRSSHEIQSGRDFFDRTAGN